jgi:hypothetical protein
MPVVSILIAVLMLNGCASGAPAGAAAGTTVPLTDLGSVAGRWAGLTDLPGHRHDDQWVELTVDGDGTYRATAARTIGFMDAQGRVMLSEGHLLVRGENGANGTATLVTVNGEKTLRVDMTASNGGRVTAHLRPQP